MFKMSTLVFVSALSVAAFAAREFSPMSIDHVTKTERRADGNFDVTCVDGSVEVRTQAELLANQVCVGVQNVKGTWKLVSGGTDTNGMRLCDVDISYVGSDVRIVSLSAQFRAPCDGLGGETQACMGRVCVIQTATVAFTFDLTGQNLLLTRNTDLVAGEYQGPTVAGSGLVRLNEVGGVQNILQVSDGTAWGSVCDDGFSTINAQVVCRELGFARVENVGTAVLVSSDNTFFKDDISCVGDEASILDCRSNQWGVHNCGADEHVTITCGN